jgi:glutamate N-acetyltransferase / amino-acid N-acetyltransferase
MTTDTLPKAISRQAVVGGKTVTVSGIAKGAGMIRPNMATMLGYVATDAAIAPALLNVLARRLADTSFNRVTVDGDTSTNDSFVVVATGRPATRRHRPEQRRRQGSARGHDRGRAVLGPCHRARRRGRDQVHHRPVEGGQTAKSASRRLTRWRIRRLVKTAFFASDPNLGRILAAVGYAGIDDLDATQIELHLGDVHVVTQGGRNPDYREEDGQRVMKAAEILVRIGLGRGSARDGLDLRLQPRLRHHQRRLPFLTTPAALRATPSRGRHLRPGEAGSAMSLDETPVRRGPCNE